MSNVEEVHNEGLLMNEEGGSAVVTGPEYPAALTDALTEAILFKSALADTQFYHQSLLIYREGIHSQWPRSRQ